jgi:hypothetical protein
MQVWIPYLATALLVADLIFMLVGSGSGWVSLAATWARCQTHPGE